MPLASSVFAFQYAGIAACAVFEPQHLESDMMQFIHYSMSMALLCFISQLKHGAL